MVLTPSLMTLLQSISCCDVFSRRPIIILREVSHHSLGIVLNYLYTGIMKYNSRRAGHYQRTPGDYFWFPKSALNDASAQEVRYHVDDPCIRDMRRVEGADGQVVSRSQHDGITACDVDDDYTRIKNGMFNYVEQDDPVSCVVKHYRIHFSDMVQIVREEHSHSTIPFNMTFEEEKLKQLAGISSITQPSRQETAAPALWTSFFTQMTSLQPLSLVQATPSQPFLARESWMSQPSQYSNVNRFQAKIVIKKSNL
eukprot:GFUD01040238.1.p1 GENE.GFUD01040238.1~~GFUD01040238.1.p1  ORF type:complete len:254 (-),score=45.84 GFUD01040238.1:665-1426(-)